LTNGGKLGGEIRAVGLSRNWYVNANMRFIVDCYKILETNRPGSSFNKDDPYGVTVRGQVFW